MIVTLLKYLAVGSLLLAGIQAEPGDRISNHPNCPMLPSDVPPHYFVHPTNCSRFYECRQQDAWEFECPAGLHFNIWLNLCDYPANAKCAPQSPGTTAFPPTTGTTPWTPTPTRDPGSVSTVTTTHWTPTPTGGPDSPTPTPDGPTTSGPPAGSTPLPYCPPHGATQPNYWASVQDCSSYWGCLEGCTQKFKCPPGLYWNDRQKQCDSVSKAECMCPLIPPAPNA